MKLYVDAKLRGLPGGEEGSFFSTPLPRPSSMHACMPTRVCISAKPYYHFQWLHVVAPKMTSGSSMQSFLPTPPPPPPPPPPRFFSFESDPAQEESGSEAQKRREVRSASSKTRKQLIT